MNDSIVTGLIEGAKVLANVQTEKARYDYMANRYNTPSKPAAAVSTEITLPGVKLNNYTTRTQLEDENDGHVKVVEHKEFIEKVPVPPTPPTDEELALEREQKKFVAKLWAGVAAVGIVVVGTIVVIEKSQSRKPATAIEL